MAISRTFLSGWHYLAAVVVAGGSLLGLNLWAKHKLQLIPGEPKGGFTTASYVVLHDRVRIGGVRSAIEQSGHRLIVLDRQTGQQVAQHLFDEQVSCWAAKGARIWCDSQGHLLNLELPSFATRGDVALLTPGKTLVAQRYAAAGGDLQVLFTDGSAATIDGETLAVSPLGSPKIYGATRGGHSYKTTSDLKRPGGGYFRFGDGPKHGLGFAQQNYGTFTPPEGAPTFLRLDSPPSFIVTSDPSLVLVLSDTSLARESPHLLTRVDEQGEKVLWQLQLGQREPGELLLEPHTAWMTMNDPALRAMAVDLDSGKALWRFALLKD